MSAVFSPRESDLGSRILKVNHAGEHGAVNIYAAQRVVARWTAPELLAELGEFQHHEEGHRALFAAELARRGRPHCRSYVLCGAGGYVLGLLTGLLGRRAMAATTVAVERVVLRHLLHQLRQLDGLDTEAVKAIRAIVREEQQHHDRCAAHADRTGSWWLRALTPVVSGATETVIWLGMKL
jgi:3-demethoxyubiquinol 3-hydroxylase